MGGHSFLSLDLWPLSIRDTSNENPSLAFSVHAENLPNQTKTMPYMKQQE